MAPPCSTPSDEAYATAQFVNTKISEFRSKQAETPALGESCKRDLLASLLGPESALFNDLAAADVEARRPTGYDYGVLVSSRNTGPCPLWASTLLRSADADGFKFLFAATRPDVVRTLLTSNKHVLAIEASFSEEEPSFCFIITP